MANPYPRQHSNTWYFGRRTYGIFMLREWSSVFVAIYVVLLVVLVDRVLAGQEAYEDYVGFLQSPLMVAFHVVALAFALLHTATWFEAMPKGLALRRGEEAVPPALVIGGNWVAWLVVSVVVAAIFLLD